MQQDAAGVDQKPPTVMFLRSIPHRRTLQSRVMVSRRLTDPTRRVKYEIGWGLHDYHAIVAVQTAYRRHATLPSR